MELKINSMLAAVMAIGISVFILATIMGFFPVSQLKDYTYSTATNTTSTPVNSTLNATLMVYVPAETLIDGETPTRSITVYLKNVNTTANYTAGIYLNGDLIGTESAVMNATTVSTITGVTLLASSGNNITVNSSAAPANFLNVTFARATYPSGSQNTEGGQGSTYDVFIGGSTQVIAILIALVIVVAAMAMYFASQGGFRGDKSK